MPHHRRGRSRAISFAVIGVRCWASESPVIDSDLATLICIRRSCLTWLAVVRNRNHDSNVPFFISGLGVSAMILRNDIAWLGFAEWLRIGQSLDFYVRIRELCRCWNLAGIHNNRTYSISILNRVTHVFIALVSTRLEELPIADVRSVDVVALASSEAFAAATIFSVVFSSWPSASTRLSGLFRT